MVLSTGVIMLPTQTRHYWRKSLKFTLHLHCLILPNGRHVMTPVVLNHLFSWFKLSHFSNVRFFQTVASGVGFCTATLWKRILWFNLQGKIQILQSSNIILQAVFIWSNKMAPGFFFGMNKYPFEACKKTTSQNSWKSCRDVQRKTNQ